MTKPVWGDISYLLSGTARQRKAYHTLQALEIFTILCRYTPTLVGTMPLNIDIEGSDLDIICEIYELSIFAHQVAATFSRQDSFRLEVKKIGRTPSVTANFTFAGFPIEIFGQPQPVTSQHAYCHMIVEDRLLAIGRDKARRGVRLLKQAGFKTEPAFARYFNLAGDPYQTLFQLATLSEDELRAVIVSTTHRHNFSRRLR
jgi:hypothetical protein